MKEIGHILQEAREIRDVTIEEAAAELKMRPQYLEALESGDASSLSNEIYLLGYLKTYAKWLGLNSSEIVRQFKSETGKITVTKKVSTESPSLFGMNTVMINPGKLGLIAGVILFMVTFFMWSGDSKDDVVDKEIANLETPDLGEPNPYAGFSYKKGQYKKVMLVAKDAADLKLYYSKDEIVQKKMKAGDMHFFENNRDVLISANNPKNVEIYSDDGKEQYFGTLEDFYILN